MVRSSRGNGKTSARVEKLDVGSRRPIDGTIDPDHTVLPLSEQDFQRVVDANGKAVVFSADIRIGPVVLNRRIEASTGGAFVAWYADTTKTQGGYQLPGSSLDGAMRPESTHVVDGRKWKMFVGDARLAPVSGGEECHWVIDDVVQATYTMCADGDGDGRLSVGFGAPGGEATLTVENDFSEAEW